MSPLRSSWSACPMSGCSLLCSGVRGWSLSCRLWGRLCSQPPQAVGRISFLGAGGLRSLAACWLSAGSLVPWPPPSPKPPVVHWALVTSQSVWLPLPGLLFKGSHDCTSPIPPPFCQTAQDDDPGSSAGHRHLNHTCKAHVALLR